MQSILASIFRLGLLRLLAGTHEAISSTATNLVSYLGTILIHVRSVW